MFKFSYCAAYYNNFFYASVLILKLFISSDFATNDYIGENCVRYLGDASYLVGDFYSGDFDPGLSYSVACVLFLSILYYS